MNFKRVFSKVVNFIVLNIELNNDHHQLTEMLRIHMIPWYNFNINTR